MAVQYWSDMSILVDDIEMAGNAKVFDLKTDVAVLDTTPLSTTGWTTVTGGLKSGTVNLEFMQDPATLGVDDTLWPLLGTAGTVKSIVTNSADGSTAYLLQSIPLSYTPVSGNVGELAMGTISGSSSTGPVVRGALLHPSNVSRTSTSTGTGRQLGAVVSRITFTTATGRTSQMLSVAGAITDDYWRVSYTIGGTGGPTFAFAVTAGII
jgi:hypothetical protein